MIFYGILLSFLGGGSICAVCQLLIDYTSLTPARILVGLVNTGVFLYSVGLYSPLFEIFGTGVSVPLIGFGANIAEGVKSSIDEIGAMGILTGGLTAAAAGITASLLLGLFFSFIFKSRPKRM